MPDIDQRGLSIMADDRIIPGLGDLPAGHHVMHCDFEVDPGKRPRLSDIAKARDTLQGFAGLELFKPHTWKTIRCQSFDDPNKELYVIVVIGLGIWPEINARRAAYERLMGAHD